MHYTGQQWDSESNLHHFMFRDYSTTQGRWMKMDPAGLAAVDITNPQTWNRYAYVTNNPVSDVDPTGLVDPKHREGHWWNFEDPLSPYENFGRDDGTQPTCMVDGIEGCGLLSSLLHDDMFNFLLQEEMPEEDWKETSREAEEQGALEPQNPEDAAWNCPGCIRPGQSGPLDPSHARNFQWYIPYKLTEKATYYRYWGSPAGQTGRDGTYYSYFDPEGVSQDLFRNQFSLPSQYNSMQKLDAVDIPAGTTVYIGPASAQSGYSGGGVQVYVPNQ